MLPHEYLDGIQNLVEEEFCDWFSEFSHGYHSVEEFPSLHTAQEKGEVVGWGGSRG